MNRNHFFLTYILLLILQILICNYLHLSLYVTLTVLPVMVLLIPINYGAVFAMIIAFLTGLTVDFLAEGVIGLNAFALIPVAFCRKGILQFVFGSELFARKENVSLKRHGLGKMMMAISLAQSIFLLLFIWADGAFARPFWFNLLKFFTSLLTGVVLSTVLSSSLTLNEHDL